MKTKTATILAIMNVLSWIAFIGISIKCGAIIFTYMLSLFNQQVAKDLYQGLNLYDLMNDSFLQYSLFVGITVGLLAIKVYVAHLAIKIISKINLTSPFDMALALQLEKISILILTLWLISLFATIYQELMDLPNMDWNGGEALFLSGLIFLFAQIFKKGAEIQAENDLTV
ncbi:hypothetical protein VR479_01050 [Aquirufa aurantiipilula]